MKKDIHPKINKDVKYSCACGASFVSWSTLKGPINLDICYNCHPFYTGQEKLIDTEGRVDAFRRKTEIAKNRKKELEAKIARKRKEALEKAKKQKERPSSIKDLMKKMQGK